MNRIPSQDDGPKRATNLSLSDAPVAEARALNINVSRACKSGLVDEVLQVKAVRWQEENAAGFDAWNTYVERNGVPLAQYRKL